MANERKLSDVILKIEADIKLLIKLYNNIDTNLKLILNNTNNFKRQQDVNAKVTPAFTEGPRKVNYPPALPFPPKKIEPPNIDAEGMAELERLIQAKKAEQKKPAQTKSSGQKTQIIQTINYPDGRKLFLANIKIYKDGELIGQTRTGPKGKWTAPLIPGEYFVHVSKADSENKKLVELKYNISVPEALEPVELEAAIIRT